MLGALKRFGMLRHYLMWAAWRVLLDKIPTRQNLVRRGDGKYLFLCDVPSYE